MPEAAILPQPTRTTTEALTTRGATFLAARYGLSTLLNVGNVFVLTWWLGPHVYGVFVTAVGITTFLSSISRAGLDTWLVRAERPPENSDYQTVFNAIALISLSLIVIGALATPLLQIWLRQQSFTLPYLTLLASVPLIGLAGVPLAKLERELAFDRVATIECCAQVVAFVIAAVLAWRGYGVWAPVAGHITWQLIVLAAAEVSTGFRPVFRTDWARARSMLSFGVGYAASARIWQLRSLVNPLVVGRLVGAEAVAFVALALRAVESLSFVRAAAGRVAIAALAKTRHDPGQSERLLAGGALWQVLMLGPLFCLLALLGPPLLPALLGARWSGALAVLPLVAAAALIQTVFNMEVSALFVAERQWVVARVYVQHLVILAIFAAILTRQLGLSGYGWAELLACIPFLFLHQNMTSTVKTALEKTFPVAVLFVLALVGSCLNLAWLGQGGLAFAILVPVIICLRSANRSRALPRCRISRGAAA